MRCSTGFFKTDIGEIRIFSWALEDVKVAEAKTLIESNVLSNDDQDRVKQVLGAVVADGRIAESTSKTYIKR